MKLWLLFAALLIFLAGLEIGVLSGRRCGDCAAIVARALKQERDRHFLDNLEWYLWKQPKPRLETSPQRGPC